MVALNNQEHAIDSSQAIIWVVDARAGITPLEIGSDIGGSLRHPANFCGVVSLKPTWGVLSLRGHIPPAPDEFIETDLGVVGPMARNIDDLRLLWNVLRGNDGAAEKPVRGSRIAVYTGLPTILGWDVHQGQQRAGYISALFHREDDVERAYASTNRAD